MAPRSGPLPGSDIGVTLGQPYSELRRGYDHSSVVYAQRVLADSPAIYWRLSETTGTTATDLSGNGRNGLHWNSTVPGAPGLLFSDTDPGVQLTGGWVFNSGAYRPFQAGTVRTFEGWANRDALSDDALIGSDHANTARLYLSSAGQSVFWQPDTAAPGTEIGWTNAWPGLGQPVHFVLVFDDPNDTASLYINGALVSTQACTGAFGADPGEFEAGDFGFGSAPFGGTLDEIALYEYGLSANRILAHYEAGVTVNSIDRVEATGPLSGAVSFAGSGLRTTFATASLSGSGSLTATGVRTRLAMASISGTGTLTATGVRTRLGTATLSASGTLTATALRTARATASLSGAGTLSAVGVRTRFATASISGSGSLAGSAAANITGTGAISGSGSLSAIGVRIWLATGSISSTGVLVAAGLRTARATATMSGSVVLIAAPSVAPRPPPIDPLVGTRGAVGDLAGTRTTQPDTAGTRTPDGDLAANRVSPGPLVGTR